MNRHPRGRSSTQSVIGAVRLAPTTRAVRAALFGSVALLALAGPGAAFAGICEAKAPNTIACNGDFVDTLPGLYDPSIDLTLVLGDSAPTSVMPAAGLSGVFLDSQANVSLVTHADIGTIDATAIDITAVGDITMVNDGAVDAYTANAHIDLTAVSATSALGDVSVGNLTDGTITAFSTGYDSPAYGVHVTTDGGAAVVTNAGDISATATSLSERYIPGTYFMYYDASRAVGVLVDSSGDATVTNSGSISASSQTTSIGTRQTVGVAAYSFNGGGLVTVSNSESGTIEASGRVVVVGVAAIGGSNYFDPGATSTVYNAGSISAMALGADGLNGALAIGVLSANTVNTGDITATAYGSGGTTRGIWATKSVDNSGTIVADSLDAENGVGWGIFLQSFNESTITNSGSIIASGGANSIGVDALTFFADLLVDNSGSISNVARPDADVNHLFNASGIVAKAQSGNATVINSGDISLECGNKCYGINGFVVDGNIVIDNSGVVALTGTYYQQGVYATDIGGAVTLTNSGSISVNAAAGLIGVNGVHISNRDNLSYSGDTNYSLDDQTTTIVNTGTISAMVNAPAGNEYVPQRGQIARGISLYAQSGDIDVFNDGAIIAQSYSYSSVAGAAVGVVANSISANIAINNAGSVLADSITSSVYGGGAALGLAGLSANGNIAIENSGALDASAISLYASDFGQTYAMGFLALSTHGDVAIDNTASGLVTAAASTLTLNTAAAYGAFASTVDGSLSVINDGSLSADANSTATAYYRVSGQTTAVGINAINLFGDDSTISNTGDLSASASTTAYGAAHAFGVSVYASSPYASATITNTGTIAASAHADGHTDVYAASSASGLSLINRYGGATTVDNSGAITADASSTLSSRASGVEIDASFLALNSSGDISATATADAALGTALATGLMATGGTLDIILASGSTLSAAASGYDGTAIGLLVAGNAVSASNAGTIEANFTGGPEGRSYGVIVLGNGDVAFANSGSITAIGTGGSVGVELSSDLSTHLTNSGTITAGVAVLAGESADVIINSGTLNGALVTGGGNDTLTNKVGGFWNVIGQSTDFGLGDDRITNAGTIMLNNASISLGGFDTLGNMFSNTGTIAVNGNSAINMGALNPSAFSNGGIISFMDGAANDVLTLTGNFAGSGILNMDVSGLHNTGDQFRILGNVATGSVSAVNVNVIDLPNTASGLIPVITVSGDSTAGSFALGTVHFNQNLSFMNLAFGVDLTSRIDTSNATADVFSVGVNVTGLTDQGTLAAAFAPGVESLMSSQIGTWRQRMGVINGYSKGGLSAWARGFNESGDMDPQHTASNFGSGGNFAFQQKNSGGELGADYAFTDQFSVGALVGKADASQRLNGTGVGSNHINGTTKGVYATWISPQAFYVDVSYRSMDFDAKLTSLAGETRASGKADAFNFEAGYNWTMGDGFVIQPQVQYTRTTLGDTDTLTGALSGFTPSNGGSSRLRVGVLAGKTFTSGSGTTWMPYASISGVRELDGKNDYVINNAFFGSTSTKGTSALVEGGLAAQFNKNLTVFGGISWQDGGAVQSTTGGQVGVRISW